MSNITKRSDLFRQYARVMDMCEGTNVSVLDCIKFSGRPWMKLNKHNNEPEFSCDLSCYDFAVAILEDKPLFIGDTVYHSTNGKMVISEYGPPVREFIDQVTWNMPERKIKIADVKLPRPLDGKSSHQVGVCGTNYYFRSIYESREFMNGLIELINRAMNETKKI